MDKEFLADYGPDIRIGPFSFLTRVYGNGTPTKDWVIAALHWKWSITWRWVLYYHAPQPQQINPWFKWFYFGGHHKTFQVHFKRGNLTLNTQPNMRARAEVQQ